MRRLSILSLTFAFLLAVGVAFGQANGKLQIHFMDVGQGDGAILVSPQGETVLFDNGVSGKCDKPVSYLRQLGVTKIDYHIATHYHADHIGCTSEVLKEFPLQKDALDRGGQYDSATYREYVTSVGIHRKTAQPGMEIMLDAGTSDPVEIRIVALNGDGVNTTNENDLSVVSLVHFGGFHAEIGGDLSGYKVGDYEDIETSVAMKVNQIEVYKVHHHGSQYSSSGTWLSRTKPMVGIISVGDGNEYGHPTQECLDRLHTASVKVYWTETGKGVLPASGRDVVGGNIVVQTGPGGQSFTVTHSGTLVDHYGSWEVPGSPAGVVSTVSAASFAPSGPLAAELLVAGFGQGLVSGIEIAPATGPLPTVLAQTSVKIRDSAGVERIAPLWFVSPSQINYYIPAQTALGLATIIVVRDAQTIATGTLQIDTVAPGLFTMNASGQGVPAALAILARGDGSQTWQYVFNTGCQVGSCQPVPLDLGAATDQVFLQLYGTGIRGRSSLAAVAARIGGVDAPVEYAGPVSGMVGLDQVNLRVPRSLIGRGEVDVVLTVDGKTANTVRVNIR